MQPIFTIHAGEYLVGSYIEQKFKNINVWIPSKDTGIDLLLTNAKNKKSISLQVKFSKDFLVTSMDDIFQKGLKSCGWWSLSSEKIVKSNADFWVFVLHTFNQKNIQFLIISPKELFIKLKNIHGDKKTLQTYLWVTAKDKCWETRELSKKDQILVATNSYNNLARNFTQYLNRWDTIIKLLK